MTWTYSGDPSDSDRDAVRFLVGDTNVDAQKVQDAEIAWTLTEEGNIYLAAAAIATAIGAKFTERVNKSVGDLKIEFSKQRDQYNDLAEKLRLRGATRAGRPYAGGISKDDKRTVRDDTDRVLPAFKKGMHDRDPSVRDSRTIEDELLS